MNQSKHDRIKMRRIKQNFCNDKIVNIHQYLHQSFYKSDLPERIQSGDRIGITVGSRGISNMSVIVKQLLEDIKSLGAKPFILAAMGSHGGATSQGQRDILASYDITEETMGVRILSSMETVRIGTVKDQIPVYFSKDALELDGIIALNRVKLHTDFKSNLMESGLSKILVIGLGKRDGAESIHSLGVFGLKNVIPEAVKVILEKAPILEGVGILENGYDQTMDIKLVPPAAIVDTDRELLKISKTVFPGLPCKDIDVAIALEMGKNISGTGLDTNVIGKLDINSEKEPDYPRINKLVVFDLTEASHGNALGIGLADITTKKLVDKINFQDTYANTITSTFLNRAKIPITMNSEKEAVEIALKTCWKTDPNYLKILIMKNTLDLEYLYVSQAIWDDIKNDSQIEASGDWENIIFSQEGNLELRL